MVYADPIREDAYKLVRRVLRVRGLEPHVYAVSEAARLAGVLGRMTEGGIVLMDAGDPDATSAPVAAAAYD